MRDVRMTSRNYSDLVTWQKAMALVESTYQATKSLPREEMYGLTSQMRKAAVSIPSNIAEGQGRGKDGQFLHALSISYGSLRELETQMILAHRLRFISAAPSQALLSECSEVGRLWNGLMQSIQSRVERGHSG
jgi:four helix bundle protein